MRLLLTRHGQSLWQIGGEDAGPDPALSSLGEIQAHRLGLYLQDYIRIDRIVASNLQRARQTAEIVASYLKSPLHIDPQLREFQTDDEGHAPLPVSIWDPAPAAPSHPAHESFRARVTGGLREAVGKGEVDETVLLVAHGGTVGTVLRVLLGATTQRLWTANTALHRLDWTGSYWLVRYLNRLEHLPRPLRSL